MAEGGVENINLSVNAGECILLCGRSGCGKTTITKLINGLIPHYFAGELSGSVKVGSLDAFQTPMYQLAEKVGSVFQNPRTQFFNIDVDSEIAFGIENEAVRPDELHQRLDATIDTLKIKPLQGRNIFELSGGEKQKIAFASVYAMNPDVYLLDEPSSNLDMASIYDLKAYLQLLKQQRKTILIAEHRLYYLMDVADRIVYLSEGKIEAIHTPESFCALSGNTRKSMGLRAVDLRCVHPKDKPRREHSVLLEVKDVALHYKKRPIVKNITLKAAKGEIIGVVGCNGTGKTTFLRTLCGLHKDYTGAFLWSGKQQNGKDRMKRSYMVMQDVNYELFADSVGAECSFGIKNPDMELVEKTLSELELIPFREKHPNTLSGGQKQRVAVAVSMICGKELLVFDEPTSGLDFDSMQQVAALIQKLAADKIIFVVTHDYEFICQVCSRIIHFGQGQMTGGIVVSEENEKQIRERIGAVDTLERKD
ncbi:energy-coupling factor transport system ATP-binding protein [Sporobacter termitidis DSM 10068]|uniref:Energy-coupling factor transport system ATP-binding protein n=2 Tax=Sporobacter TaxID=44748 RepID=A0A1M5W589_9FIRM|nr:energy-coupling factor transport system ATP-binding protein [Sporobacter termitidis DSM 10068]